MEGLYWVSAKLPDKRRQTLQSQDKRLGEAWSTQLSVVIGTKFTKWTVVVKQVVS